MTRYIADIEADGLLDSITKIHCLAYCDTKTGLVCSTSYTEQIKDFFLQEDITLIMHNGVGYDIPAIEKVLGIKVKCKVWDSLAVSWVLYPDREKHGLEYWGEDFGIKKPEIKDWNSLTIQEYIHRCEEDVKINWELWKKQAKYLNTLFEGDHQEIIRYLDYLSFKMDCIKEHQELGVKLDTDLCNSEIEKLELLKQEKLNNLKSEMPKRPIKSIKVPPRIMYKKDGSPSENRLKWLEFLKNQGLPETHNKPVEYISDYEEPNPGSHDQIKNWLFSLGWKPKTFDYKKQEGTSQLRKVPQIKDKNEGDGSLCQSVLDLVEKEPVLENLDSLFIISHRINVLKGFLREQKNGRLYQGCSSFTNTLRLQHRVIVNLPNVSKAYSENVRRCLIADEGKIMIGCDLKGIEDNTKRHYIYPLDPEYVKEQMIEGFDAHLDIANLAGFLTKEQVEEHKKGVKSYKVERSKGKTVNFAAVYGVGFATLSRNSGLPERECKKLLDIYWKRNWAVKKLAETFVVKTVNNQKWIKNPISGFWYTLRAEKDRFSTVNQSSAVYVFDRWLFYIRNQGIKVNMQIHDEFSANLYEEYKESYVNKIKSAIKSVNNELKLNIEVDCSIDFGKNYVEVH